MLGALFVIYGASEHWCLIYRNIIIYSIK